MPTFIVESYGGDGAAAGERERAELAAALGLGIIYLRTTILPGDETLFHVFAATSQDALRSAVAAAELGCDRIVEVQETSPTADPVPAHGASG
jgi:hypothetical protein